jgi:hypothetical protein
LGRIVKREKTIMSNKSNRKGVFKGMAVRNMAAPETVAVGNWSKQVELRTPVPGGKVTHISL